MDRKTALVWLRNDLRIEDNPALFAALRRGQRLLAVYIHETDPGIREVTGAARWWLHRSLNALASALATMGIELRVEAGISSEIIARTVNEEQAGAVYWNRRYGVPERNLDACIKTEMRDLGVEVESFNASLLVEPWEMATGQGKSFSVFTPFWNALRRRQIAQPAPIPGNGEYRPLNTPRFDGNYHVPTWARKLEGNWPIGEEGARARLGAFLERISGYETARDLPGQQATSLLAPHLRFGEIGPRQVWHTALAAAHRCPELTISVEKFLSELAWREFNHHLNYHRENIAETPMQPRFAGMEWRQSETDFDHWCAGMTGFPLVDAGMRELWQTGYMHNRVRMITASLLTKNLLIDWRRGERWFWDCLVDADGANNPANWQWVAGSGLDAAPWFRIFNPITQGERFDPEGHYTRQWVPELAALPDKWIHRPHAAPSDVLQAADVVLGETYPHPIVDLAASRKRALEALPGR